MTLRPAADRRVRTVSLTAPGNPADEVVGGVVRSLDRAAGRIHQRVRGADGDEVAGAITVGVQRTGVGVGEPVQLAVDDRVCRWMSATASGWTAALARDQRVHRTVLPLLVGRGRTAGAAIGFS